MLSSILRKLINSKSYSKAEIVKRVNTFYAVAQLNEEEYLELMGLIETAYTTVQ